MLLDLPKYITYPITVVSCIVWWCYLINNAMCNALWRSISRVLYPLTNFIAWLRRIFLTIAPSRLLRYINFRENARKDSETLEEYEMTQVTTHDTEIFSSQYFPSVPVNGRARFCDVDDGNSYHGGTVAWTGYRNSSGDRLIVLAVNDDYSFATNGEFDGQMLVGDPACYDAKHFIMLPYKEVEALPVLRIGDYCIIRKKTNTRSLRGGFIRGINGYYKLHMLNTNYKDERPVKGEIYPDHQLVRAPPPEVEHVSQNVEAIRGCELQTFIGRNKGIQGKRNSCYLDTILFSFFTFSDDLNNLLFGSDDDRDYESIEVLNILRYRIIFPLRANQFVSYHHVEELRKLMAQRTENDKFETDTRDIPECMDALFGQMLHIQPMVSIGHYVNGRVHFNDTFAVEVFNVDSIPFPTSMQLLERSAVSMQFCLQKMTNCLLIQLAREIGQSMFVSPNLRLDLKNLIYNTVKVCSKCRCKATLQFWQASTDISNTFFCEECAVAQGFDLEHSLTLPETDFSEILNEETELSLVAVICIERSHYNCFVRTPLDSWVFFDSMYDQDVLTNPESGIQESVNIPVVKEVPKFRQWLDDAPKVFRNHRSLEPFFENKDNMDLLMAERLFLYPSLLIYKNI